MLLRTLLKLSLLPSGAVVPELREQLCAAPEQAWQDVLTDLELHRLMPFVFYGVKLHDLVDCVPRSVLSQLLAAYLYSLRRNKSLFQSLAAVLKPTHAAGVHPVLWKGVVLADHLYPDRAVRMMGDIDWAIAPHELETVSQVFDQLGFTLQPQMTTPDAVYFKNAGHIFFDVHHRVRLFEGKEHLPLTQNLIPFTPELPSLQILEPTAMLTHLTVHLTGHLSETGPLLFWILDFVFLLRKWGHLIDQERLDQLMPDAQSWLFLGRVLRFLEVELEEPLPPALSKFAQHYKPLTLESITRQCRLAVWGLPRPKGWLKLMACRLGMQPLYRTNYPQTSDLLLWPTDAALTGNYRLFSVHG